MEVVLLLVILLPVGWCRYIDIEAESGVHNGQVMLRADASNMFTVWLHKGENISFMYNVLMNESCQVKISEITWSNDGLDDVLDIYIDGIYTSGVATVHHTGDGHYWNNFFTSELSGSYTSLMYGRHSIMVYATTTDDHGAEIDRIRLESLCDEYNSDEHNCQPVELSAGAVVGIVIASIVFTSVACVALFACVFICSIQKQMQNEQPRPERYDEHPGQ